MTLLHLTLGDLERSKSMSPRFGSIISHKRAELGDMLLLNININWKACMGSPLVRLHLTSELTSQCHCHSDFEVLYFAQEQSYTM